MTSLNLPRVLPGRVGLSGELMLLAEVGLPVFVLPGVVELHEEVGLPGEMGLPSEATEGLWQRVERVSLHDEDLELHQSLDVLCQVLQMVTGQV